MQSEGETPKSFGEILDRTFRIVKQHFSGLYLIMLLLLGPIYIVHLLFMIAGGSSFFRQTADGESWIESLILSMDDPVVASAEAGELFLYSGITLLLSILLIPVALAAVLQATDKIERNEPWNISHVLKKALSRLGGIWGGSVLFFIMIGAYFTVSIFAVSMTTAAGVMINPVLGVILAFLIGLGLLVFGFFLFTRLSMFFAAVTFEKVSPGISKSWKLTRKRFWAVFGLYFVFQVIMVAITYVVQAVTYLLLGASVLANLIIALVLMFTSMIFFVGYAQIYLDLKVRNEAGDLKAMISSYRQDEQAPDTTPSQG